jgi:UDP-N-acetylmuramoyl-tripeptide--D-alanyl-D-alanine ligase
MAAAMRAQAKGALPEAVTGISIDSRTIAPGDAYFAIRGAVHDGHDFVAAALKAGAGLAVVEAAQRGRFAADAPLLVVDDVLAALVDLARAARARLDAKVIAVTGSVGKTSTKEALRRVLGAQGETHASAASFNNHWGVPLCDFRNRHEPRERNRTIGEDGAAAGRDRHHGRAGASRILQGHRGNRRRQGGNL